MATRFRQMDPAWTIAALGVYGLMLAVSAWRWRLLLRLQTIDVSLGTLTKSFLVATFFNNFLPSNIGGDVVRVADTAPFAGSKTLATTVVLIDRVIGLIALLVLAAAASTMAWNLGLRLKGMEYVWIALVLFTGGLLLCLRNPERLARTARSVLADRLLAVQTRLQNLVNAMGRFAQQPRGLWSAFGGALIVQALLDPLLRLRRAQPGGALPSPRRLRHRPDQPGRADGAGVDQRLRGSRSGVCVLLHRSRPQCQLGLDAVARQRRAHHVVLAERRGGVHAQAEGRQLSRQLSALGSQLKAQSSALGSGFSRESSCGHLTS